MYHISFYIKRKEISKSISKKNCVVQKTKRETKSQEDCDSFLFLSSCLSGGLGVSLFLLCISGFTLATQIIGSLGRDMLFLVIV